MQKQILRQMQKKLQASLTKVQDELANEIVEASAGGGAVKVQANGQQQIVSIKLDASVVDPENVDLLEDLILTATKEALEKSNDLAGKRMGALTGGLNIPGLPF
ncbi:MAG: YbaB/EbfC family nucleoid-associated protein [Armatimonadetes bacterium]|nr:YbaB/EbfC family nucleoid-associated protein [Armatimonadota bacterium]